MSDFTFSNPAKLKKALQKSIKMARREKMIRKEFNQLSK